MDYWQPQLRDNLLFFGDFFIGRFFCVYPTDAHYCFDPRVIAEPADGLQSSLFFISQIVSS